MSDQPSSTQSSGKSWFFWILNIVLWVLIVLFAFLSVVSLIGIVFSNVVDTTDGPFATALFFKFGEDKGTTFFLFNFIGFAILSAIAYGGKFALDRYTG